LNKAPRAALLNAALARTARSRHDRPRAVRSPGVGRSRQEDPLKKAFFPKGAIASFLVMIGFYGVVWFALYFIMLSRG
jgi:hypothetical protein